MSKRPSPWLDQIAEVLAVVLLLAQLIGVLRSPFVVDRFFSWSPHDQRVDYAISARVQGESVDAETIRARYGMPARGLNWHAYGDVLQLIELVEDRLPEGERWEVGVDYSVNLGESRTWRLGEPIR